MTWARFFRVTTATVVSGWLLTGCAALNGVNQLLNNVIGSTAATASKAVNTLTPAANSAKASYSQFKTKQQYEAEQQKRTAQYDRRHPLRDQDYQPKSHPQKKVRTKKHQPRAQVWQKPPKG
ncbi:MAG: hypothetical protein HZB26_25955 [Candidatus Hydrogenedentes bacterium]|nr:hypothetical protein [Candidatus Hydrogenedentota bacterium]